MLHIESIKGQKNFIVLLEKFGVLQASAEVLCNHEARQHPRVMSQLSHLGNAVM